MASKVAANMARPGRSAWLVRLLPCLLMFLASVFTPAPAAGQASNPIVLENQQPGTDQWRGPLMPYGIAGLRQSNDAGNQIKGYPSAASVNKGQSLTFYVTVNPVQTFTIDIYRMGWYGGLGGRLMQHAGPFDGIQQPSCPVIDAGTSLIACNWSASYSLTVPNTWTDGIYLAVLSNAQNFQNYVPFAVRDDARHAAFLYQQPVNTYQAYNNWGGKSLYPFNSTNGARAYKVSFDRPYADDGSGDYFSWEVYLVQWLEQQGYDVTYTTDVDVQANPGRVTQVKGVLVGGHGEYWTAGIYNAIEGARDAGVSLAFFGSNAGYWQVRYEASAAGEDDRVLVCYKTNEDPEPTDPITATDPALTTTQWRLAPLSRPEQSLLGIQFTSQTGTSRGATVDYVVSNSDSWVYAGTGLTNGSTVPGIVGYEVDRVWQEYAPPRHQSFTLLAQSPFTSVAGDSDHQNTSIYQDVSGAWVFASGTLAWSWALARPGFVNTGLQRATANVLNRFLNGG